MKMSEPDMGVYIVTRKMVTKKEEKRNMCWNWVWTRHSGVASLPTEQVSAPATLLTSSLICLLFWVKGNHWADRLGEEATITSCLHLRRSEVLRSLRHYLRAQSQGHHTIDRLEARGMERGNAQQSSLKGRERTISQSDKNWNCFKGNTGETSERQGGVHVGFTERIDIVLNWPDRNFF